MVDDIDEAYMCGQEAVALAKQGKTGLMITLERAGGNEYRCITGTAALNEIAIKAKPMPDEYISADGSFITDAFLDYLSPLMGELPNYARLACNRV